MTLRILTMAHGRSGFGLLTLLAVLTLAAMPAKAERVSLNSLLNRIEQLEAAQSQGPTRISECQEIDRSGSYVVVQDIFAPGGNFPCLNVTASLVTIDLGGFRLFGASQAVGIGANGSSLSDITVQNGYVLFFGDGVELSNVERATVRNVSANASGGTGIRTGTDSTVTGNTAIFNFHNGIAAGANSIVTGNRSFDNETGIAVTCVAIVTGNVAEGNSLANLDLDTTSGDCLADNNIAP